MGVAAHDAVVRCALVFASCAALAGCLPVPSLIAQSSVVPVATAGQSAEPRGIVGADVRAVIRPFELPQSGEPTSSPMYVPRVQLEPSLWLRANRYVTVALVSVVGFRADSYSLGPTTEARPSGDAWAIGAAVAGFFPVDRENRLEMGVQVAVGETTSTNTYLPPVLPCGTGCSMRDPPYTEQQSLPIVLASTQLRYVHQFGPAALITLLGVGTQPIHGPLGGESASMNASISLLAGLGARIDLTDWLAVEVLVVLPVGAVMPGPLVSLGLAFAGREPQHEPLSATSESSPRPPG